MRSILFISLILFASSLFAQDITGTWNGLLEIPGMQLAVIFHIEETNEKYITTMDSPDQGAMGIPTDSTGFENNELRITIDKLKVEYAGKWMEESNSIEGIFKQAAMSFPLNLTRKEVEKKDLSRPQDPKDFPYIQEEVNFVNVKGGHKLAGTLTLPSDGQFDQVEILITGSGPQNRNEELLGHRPFLVLSDHFTRNGIAVLRYDERGVGEPEGDFGTATSADFAKDVNAAVDYLLSRDDMDGKKIGLTGHSEGAMIAPMVAAERQDLDHILLLAGPGINIIELMMLQTSKMAEAEGASKEIVEANSIILRRTFNYLNENQDLSKEEVTQGLTHILTEGYEALPATEREKIGDKENYFKEQSGAMTSEWFRYFIGFDPQDYLEKVSCPILAVNGELDLQVTAIENLKGIEEACNRAGNKDLTLKEFPGLNHLFQKATTGASSEYAKIDETFNVAVMDYLVAWILKQ